MFWALPDAIAVGPGGELLRRLWRLEGRGSKLAAATQSPDKPDDARNGEPGPDPIGELLAVWLTDAELAPVDRGYAIEAVAWARALPRLVGVVDETLWWQLWNHLVSVAGELTPASATADPCTAQLLAAELPLTLAYQFPEFSVAASLAEAGEQAARQSLQETICGEGLAPVRHWDSFRPLLACWTRSWTIAAEIAQRRGDKKRLVVPPQFAEFLATAMRLCRPDGSQMLVHDGAGQWNRHLFAAAASLADDASIDVAARRLRLSKKSPRKGKRRRRAAASVHVDKADAAVLSSGWKRSDLRLAVTYADHRVQLELAAAGHTLLSGCWETIIQVAGQAIAPASKWEQVCWHSDHEIDYLEIETHLTEGVRVQRQIVLAREDRFLLLADALLANEPATLDYASTLPLMPHVTWTSFPENTEAMLSLDKPRALVLPLALPEWRSVARPGDLRHTPDGLELRMTGTGNALFAPLFFDLDPRRLQKPYTWRQLTVGESLKAVPRDAAVAYRVEIGKQQWLIYRSLKPSEPRTALGQHIAHEFVVARFLRPGVAKRILEIESDAD